MKRIVMILFILMVPGLSFAGASATVSNYVGAGYMMGSMNSDIVPGNAQGFSFKIHTHNLAFVVIKNANGVEGRCSISGASEFAKDFYNTLAHLKDGSVFIVYHDQSTDAYHGTCTGFVHYADTRFMTER